MAPLTAPARIALVPVAVAALLAGCSAAVGAGPEAAPPGSVPATAVPVPTTTTTTARAPAPRASADVRAFEGARDHRTVAEPVWVRIPAIAVDAELEALHRNPDGTIQLPAWHRAGWWAGGPKPGQLGPAVILGHVDSTSGPAVFRRLQELQPGDEVVVTRVDGSVARFSVERLERHPKTAFPTEAVYAPSLEAGLRLVTCGGTFDRSTGHYRDNVVVFATPIG